MSRVNQISSKKWMLNDSLILSRPYFLTAMVKFPKVFSKNGVINTILSIFVVGGLCSTLSNLTIAKVSEKTNQKSYSGISQCLFGKSHSLVMIVLYIQKSIGIFYLVDLSFKLLHSISFLNISNDLEFLGFLVILNSLSFIIFNKPENLNFARARNILTLITLLILTSYYAISKYELNIGKIHFTNPSESFFDSFGLLSICFAQQISTTPLVSDYAEKSKLPIFLAGLISSSAYISIGVAGYIFCQEPEINWIMNLENKYIKSIVSLILLGVNTLAFPLLINSVVDDINRVVPEAILKNISVLPKILAAIFYSTASIYFVSTKSLIMITLLSSSIVSMILPSIFYNQVFAYKPLRWKLITTFNILIGLILIFKAVKDIVLLFMTEDY